MSEYYAVHRSEDHLQHYGVKGMKWGVRKALASGDSRKLNRQYRKAQKKLDKLNKRANISLQKEAVKKHNRRALAALGVSAAGMALVTETNSIAKDLLKKLIKPSKPAEITSPLFENKPSARKKWTPGMSKPIFKKGDGIGGGPVGNMLGNNDKLPVNGTPVVPKPTTPKPIVFQNKNTSLSNPFILADRIGTAATLGGIGAAAYQKGRAIAAKYRTTAKGHANAVAKRDAWKKEMRSAFKGTVYDASGSVRKKKSRVRV